MKSYYTVLLLVAYSLLAFGQSKSTELRSNYLNSSLDESKMQSFKQSIEKTTDTKLKESYAAVYLALEAKYGTYPIYRYKKIKESLQKLDDLAAKYSKDLEIRFLRMSIQSYTPKWLGFSDDITQDKEFILNNLNNTAGNQLEPEFKQAVFDFLEYSECCTDKELASLSNSL